MANTSNRALRLLTLLQTHRFWPGAELAQRLEVSARTLRRDVDRLRELGYPVDATRGADGGYQLAPGAALPPLVVADDEAVGICVALQNLASTGDAALAESAVSALAKVTAVLPKRLRRRVDALRTMTMAAPLHYATPTDTEALTVIAMACRDEERLRFAYVAADGARTEREVEPHRLVSRGQRWYLVAYDLTRHDWRTFRADRIRAPQRTGQHFRPRELPAVDAATFVEQRFAHRTQDYDVEVRIDASVERVRRVSGRWADLTARDDGSCVLRMTVGELEWAVFLLGQLDAPFHVVRPPELREMLASWRDRFAEAAG